ncbi:phage tail tape measure protein [Paenibacillus graminis]|uniref:phage tail tape measure protein n=1 Tax=Paenibacillus graminis TaxID=189425 RepID=UPI00046EFC89|nr:phage tail tape measure protein [Paenibacillus graminis]
MSLLGNLVINILGNNTGLDDAMKQAQKSVDKFGKGMADVGKSLTSLVTVPLVAVGGASLKVASDFESAFAGVRKTVDATEEQFGELRQGIRDMAKEMPQSASDIAKVGEAAGQLGIKTEAILGFTKTMVNLGVATNMTSDEAASALARLANITQMPQDQFGRLGSSIVALGNNFATTESEITDMALRLAGAGHQVGMSEADILGLSAALSSVGVEAEMGGSAISRVMVRMQVAASSMGKVDALTKATGMSLRELQLLADNNSKDFKALADALGMTQTQMGNIVEGGVDLQNFSKIAGVTSDQFKKSFETDAVGALTAFINGLGNADQAGTSAINMLEEMGITEIRLRDSLLRLGNAGDLVTNATKLSNEAWDENAALTHEAEERYKTFASQMQIFKNKLTDIGITIGDAIMPVVLQAVDALQPLIDKITSLAATFSTLEPAKQQMIIVGAAIAAALGPVLVIAGQIVSAISSLMPVFAALTGPVGLIVAAVAGLTAGLVYLYKTNDTVRDALNSAWESIKAVALAAWGVIGSFIMGQIDKIKKFWDENGSQILQAVTNVFNGIKKVIEFIMPAVKFIIDMAWTAIKNVISGALDIIMGLIKVFSGLFTGDWGKMWEGIKQVLSGALDFVMGLMTLNFLGGLKTLFTNLLKSGVGLMKSMGEGIVNAFKGLHGSATSLISKMVYGVINFFKNMFTEGIGIFTRLRTLGASIWNALTQAVTGAARSIYTQSVENFKTMLTAIKNIFSTIQGVIEKIWTSVVNFFKKIDLVGIGKNIIQGLINGIGSMASAVTEKTKEVSTKIRDTIKNFFGIHSPSKLTTGYGENISEGLAVGINNSKDKAKAAIESLTGEAAEKAAKAAAQAADKAQKAAEKAAEKAHREAAAAAKKAATAANKAFNDALGTAQYKYKMGTIDEAAYIASLEKVKQAYAKTTEQVQKINLAIKKANDDAAKEAAAKAKEQFEASKTYIEAKKQANEISLQQELTAWEKLQTRYKVGSTERIAIDKQVNKIRADLAKEAADAAKKALDAQIASLDKLNTAVTTALKARYAAEEKAATEALQKRIDEHKAASDAIIAGYDAEYQASLKTLDAETQAKLLGLQDQIDGIEGLTKAEDIAAEEAAYQKKLADKQKELTDADTAESRAKIQQELDDMLAERQRKYLLEQRQVQIDALKAEMTQIKSQSDQKAEALRLEYENKKATEEKNAQATTDSLTAQMEATKTHYANLNTEEALQAEVRRLALDSNNKELIDLLTQYNPQWQDAGQTFGESLLKGLNSTKTSIQAAVNEILGMIGKTASAANAGNMANEIAYLNNLLANGTAAQKKWAEAQAKEYGLQIVNGVIKGMTSGTTAITNAAAATAQAATDSIKDTLKIKSPSRVMIAIGEFIGKGLALGMERQLSAVEGAAQDMADAAAVELNTPGMNAIDSRVQLPVASGSSAGTATGLMGDGELVLNQNIYLDGKQIETNVSRRQWSSLTKATRGMGLV